MSYNKTDYTRSDARCTSPPRMSGFAGCGEGSRGLRRGMPLLHGCCLSRPGEEPCYQQAEDEPADVGEERHAAPVRRGAEQPEARFDELVQEPHPEEDPGRDPDQEDREDP